MASANPHMGNATRTNELTKVVAVGLHRLFEVLADFFIFFGKDRAAAQIAVRDQVRQDLQ